MNPNWQNFLKTQQATFLENGNIQFPQHLNTSTAGLYPIPQLTALKITGKDAEPFLQGQLTCNVKKLTPNNSFFAAFCNAKGRTISTLLLYKQHDDFFLILPTELHQKVQKKLQMYILRSDVKIVNATEELCISGLYYPNTETNNTQLPDTPFSRKNDHIKLADSHYLIIANTENSQKHWNDWLNENLQGQNSEQWDYLDIGAGLAWLTENSSEEYIPQMLNIDKLGGISFNKGCYTGQEVVARTHYLGQAKRALFVAECSADVIAEDNSVINENGDSVGKIIKAQKFIDTQKLLIVMQTIASKSGGLRLNNDNQNEISVL